jgi:hypothetical protein
MPLKVVHLQQNCIDMPEPKHSGDIAASIPPFNYIPFRPVMTERTEPAAFPQDQDDESLGRGHGLLICGFIPKDVNVDVHDQSALKQERSGKLNDELGILYEKTWHNSGENCRRSAGASRKALA